MTLTELDERGVTIRRNVFRKRVSSFTPHCRACGWTGSNQYVRAGEDRPGIPADQDTRPQDAAKRAARADGERHVSNDHDGRHYSGVVR